LQIETGRGVLTLELTIEGDAVRRVCVDMGEPILDMARIPVELLDVPPNGRVVDVPVGQCVPIYGSGRWMDDCGLEPRMTCVSMGNPHLVMYCRKVAAVPLETVGPFFERQPIFPNRINVHFVEIQSSDEATIRTWERGSGITLACGTGACAACVAGVLTGRTGNRLLAHVPGGDLELHWAADNHVFLTGEAVEVFSGRISEKWGG
jgi:diaminopimelate epimerase